MKDHISNTKLEKGDHYYIQTRHKDLLSHYTPYPNIPRAPPQDKLEHSRVFKLFFSPEFQPNILAPIYVAWQSTYRPGNSDGQLE